MLDADALAAIVRRLKKQPLVADGHGVRVDYPRHIIEHLLPHRGPMLLLDGIDAVDLDTRAVSGHRRLLAADPGFDGHFPGDPVYPGVLVVEAIGQLGLTLVHFAGAMTTAAPVDAGQHRVRAVHIHRATFLAPFAPGDTMQLQAQVVDGDEMTMIAAGQAWKNGTLAAFAVSEVYLDE